MKKTFTLLFYFFIVSAVSAQISVGTYAGFDDRPGLSVEYQFASHYALQLSSSYRSSDYDYLLADAYKTDRNLDSYTSLIAKKYLTTKKETRDKYAGIYARFEWHQSKILDSDNLTTEQQQFTADNYIVYNRITYKFTVGVLRGHRFGLGPRFYWGLRYGIGLSPGVYYTMEEAYGLPKNVRSEGENEFIGNLVYIDMLVHLKFGYRFGR